MGGFCVCLVLVRERRDESAHPRRLTDALRSAAGGCCTDNNVMRAQSEQIAQSWQPEVDVVDELSWASKTTSAAADSTDRARCNPKKWEAVF